MSKYKDLFMSHMDAIGIKYAEVNENVVSVAYKGDNMDSIAVFVHFDKDGDNDVRFVVWHIGKFPDNKLGAGLVACNALNAKFRWIKFYIDNDSEGCAECDAVLDENSAGEECMSLVRRTVSIVDDAYPELMRALYA